MSLGKYRVGITFNPSNNPDVDEIKQRTAELIDLVEDLKSGAQSGEVLRLIALAQTYYEDAAMWAVKAVTKPARDA